MSFFISITNHDLDIVSIPLNAQSFFAVKCLTDLPGKITHGNADGARSLLYPNFFFLFAGFEIV